MPEWLNVIILGIVEGITEFLPISSTGHLLVVSAFLESDLTARLGGTFEIFIQLGAVIAVVAFYRDDIFTQVRTVHKDRSVQRLWLAILVASIPAALIGFLLRDFIKDTLFPQETAPFVVATTLILGGIIFLLVERRPNQSAPTVNSISEITLRQALLIGLAQTTALIPGVSRSGASIIGSLLLGISRSAATAFSFYLAIPVLGGATVLDLLLSLDEIQSGDLVYLLLGTVVSGVVAWISIGWLLRYVSSNTFIAFGYYRIVAGLVILALIVVGVL
ncbi:MAG: undecaprenyl-diphosphate phosphatase [Anaerolineae bacterium]